MPDARISVKLITPAELPSILAAAMAIKLNKAVDQIMERPSNTITFKSIFIATDQQVTDLTGILLTVH